MTKISTLWCEPGEHSWERPTLRGRKPVKCPEHEHLPMPVGGSPLDKARLAKATRKNSEWEATKQQVQEILNDPRMNEVYSSGPTDTRPITVDKLKYLVKTIEEERTTRMPHEIADLEGMIKKILKDPYSRQGHLL